MVTPDYMAVHCKVLLSSSHKTVCLHHEKHVHTSVTRFLPTCLISTPAYQNHYMAVPHANFILSIEYKLDEAPAAQNTNLITPSTTDDTTHDHTH